MNSVQIRKACRLFLQILVLAAGCSSVQVNSLKDPTVDLAHYRTFEWAPAQPGTLPPNGIVDKQIRHSVQTELAKIGVQPAPPGAMPDFVVTYAARTQNIATSGGGAGVGLGIGIFPGVGVGVSAPVGSQTRIEQQTTLTLSFLDARNHQEIWQGTGVGPLEGADQYPGTIQSEVQKLVDDFRDSRQGTG